MQHSKWNSTKSPWSFYVVWLRGIPWKIFHENSMEWFSWKVFHGIPWSAWSIKVGLLKCGIAIENISNRAKNFFRSISLCFNWTMNAKSLKNHWWLKNVFGYHLCCMLFLILLSSTTTSRFAVCKKTYYFIIFGPFFSGYEQQWCMFRPHALPTIWTD